MAILYDGCTDQNRRAVNMDSLLLTERLLGGQKTCLAVVCDGVGSTQDGAYASSAAVKMLWAWYNNIEHTGHLGLQLRGCVLEISRFVEKAAQLEGLQTASTLSALLICGEKYYVTNVGDSRVYCMDGGTLFQLTRDHTSDGKLTSWIGRPDPIDVFYEEGTCLGKRFLVCSDGLYKRMDLSYLQKALLRANKKNIRKVAEQMIQHVMDQGEGDNISAAIVVCES